MKKDYKIYMIPQKKTFAQKDILNFLPLTLNFIEGGERGSKESSHDVKRAIGFVRKNPKQNMLQYLFNAQYST